LSATFNAPIAAVLFGIEIILGKLSSYFLIPLLISSTTGTLIARHFLGDFRAFSVPHLSFSVSMLFYFPILSLVSAITVIFFTTSLKFLERLRLLLKEMWLLPVLIFSLLTAFLLYFFPQAQGVGYRELTLLFEDHFSPMRALQVGVVKLITVTLTFGSGLFGGFMAPAIFVGAFNGYFLGSLLGLEPKVFALVGSAALLAGISGAPLRSSLVIVELTQSYQLIVPVLLTSAITSYFIGAIKELNFFKRALFYKGIDPDSVFNLAKLQVQNFIKFIRPVCEDDTLEELRRQFLSQECRCLPVVDKKGKLVGVVCLRELRLASLCREKGRVKEIMIPEPFSLKEDADLKELLKALVLLEGSKVPVVNREGLYVGMFDPNEFFKALSF
jgi:CIC family chloride channel protein